METTKEEYVFTCPSNISAEERHVWDIVDSALNQCVEERKEGFDACVRVERDRIEIDTRMSRDPRRASNGGEYYYWLTIYEQGRRGNNAWAREACSCDFWQPQEQGEALGITYSIAQSIVKSEARNRGIPIMNPDHH